jgi:hypothetical protein
MGEFLKTFYCANNKKVSVNLPSAFGKTTLLEMVKQFFEIKEDPNTGRPYEMEKSPNYKLFANRTKVFADQEFCEFFFEFINYFVNVYDFQSKSPTTSGDIRSSIWI